jgi:hypothetical protein
VNESELQLETQLGVIHYALSRCAVPSARSSQGGPAVAKLLRSRVSVSMAAKAYRLLRSILTTAVEEDKILAATHAVSAEPEPSEHPNAQS